jgi:hAT family C-terminal dimerisation region
VPCWLQLEHELKALAQVYSYLEPILAPGGVFNKRLNTQTQLIHWAAFILDPISSLQVINAEGKKLAIEWILDKVEHRKEVHYSIQDFLSKEGGFTKAYISQLHVNNPVRYWKCYFDNKHYNKLAQLAVRIFKTIANSVASERAFLAMGLIVTKLRNRLGPEKADKLIFIYMNQQVLDRSGCDLLLRDWVDKSDKD